MHFSAVCRSLGGGPTGSWISFESMSSVVDGSSQPDDIAHAFDSNYQELYTNVRASMVCLRIELIA